MESQNNHAAALLRSHLQTCVLHKDERALICHGKLKRGGNCSHKAIKTNLTGTLPMCRIHRNQQKRSASCRAPLSCNLDCGRICEWQVHGFQLCPDHREYSVICYFFRIPLEMRLKIYAYLLPDIIIPASWGNSIQLTSHHERISTKFFRVNHQIHEEATSVLYSTRAFTIELSTTGLQMCNSRKYNPWRDRPTGIRRDQALQDYQMQLMLLEQQNKKRLMIARQEQANDGTRTNSTTYIARPTALSEIITESTEPVWQPQLSGRYFDLIQHFRIEIVLPHPQDQNSGPRHGSLLQQQQLLETRLYDYCDEIHRLVGRFRFYERPISRLDIVIQFGRSLYACDHASTAAAILLRPFQRLRRIQHAQIIAITMMDEKNCKVELLNPHWSFISATDEAFHDYLRIWSADLARTEPAPEANPILVAYWQLKRLLAIIHERSRPGDSILQPLVELLHNARIAREYEDFVRFREVWDRIVNIWHDYLKSQRKFQSTVALGIGKIQDTLEQNEVDLMEE